MSGTMIAVHLDKPALPERVALSVADAMAWYGYYRRVARFWKRMAAGCIQAYYRTSDPFWRERYEEAGTRWEHAMEQMHAYHGQLVVMTRDIRELRGMETVVETEEASA